MRILIPVDFSEASARMLRFAFALNSRFTADLQVLHLFDIPITAGDDGEVYLRNYEAYRKSFEDELWDFVRRNRGQYHYDTQVFASSGGHYQGIVSFAGMHRPDLVIVGHKGAGKVARWMFGSVSRYLLTHPPAPVLSVPSSRPETAEAGFRKILLATDLSGPLPPAQTGFLLDFARRMDAKVGLLHARLGGEVALPEEAPLRASLAATFGSPVEDRDVLAGEDIARTLLAHMKEHGYDLLVTMPHRHTWIDRLLIGSETRQLADIADVAILALPER